MTARWVALGLLSDTGDLHLSSCNLLWAMAKTTPSLSFPFYETGLGLSLRFIRVELLLKCLVDLVNELLCAKATVSSLGWG